MTPLLCFTLIVYFLTSNFPLFLIVMFNPHCYFVIIIIISLFFFVSVSTLIKGGSSGTPTKKKCLLDHSLHYLLSPVTLRLENKKKNTHYHLHINTKCQIPKGE